MNATYFPWHARAACVRPVRSGLGVGSRLITRNASVEKSKKYPGCTSTFRFSSRSRTRLSSETVAGTRMTAYHPPFDRKQGCRRVIGDDAGEAGGGSVGHGLRSAG